ncbi:MAG TPA: phosphatidylglycerophosphatase A [Candidatus Kapabacteria bacterium]|nr:phosphatidylglycerophosphatase A [Candidatus Kapabacteria bacterium]
MQQNAVLTPSSRKQKLPGAIKYFVSAFGVGFMPIASGTWGSAFALLFYLFIPGFWHWYVILPASLIVLLPAIPASTKAEHVYGDDPSMVVIDEVVGMWITLASPLFPFSWVYAIVGFFLFRLFDIVKPFPANRFDAMKGGFGIMMDDVVSGIYANIATHLIIYGLGLFPFVYEFLKH